LKSLANIVALFLCLTVPGLGLASVSDCCRDLSMVKASALPETAKVSEAHHHASAAFPVAPMASHQQATTADPANHDQANDPFGQNCGLLSCLKAPTATQAVTLLAAQGQLDQGVALADGFGFVPKEFPKSIFRPPRQLPL
jgi:hypothetical protein